jgi:hypothetical protein
MSAEPPAARPAGAGIARRGVVLFIVLFLLLAGVAFFVPPLFLVSGVDHPTPAHFWRSFREGGWGMWAILFSQTIAWGVIAVLGALVIRGTRVPGAILGVAALAPFGVGTLAAVAAEMQVSGAIAGPGLDADSRARVLANGISELANLHVYGGFAAAFAMFLTAIAAVLGVVTVDPASLGARPRSSAWVLAIPVGLACAVASVAARVVLHVGFLAGDGLILLGILSAGILAALGGKALPALCAPGRGEDAGQAFRLLLLAAFTLAAAMLLSDRALLAASIRAPLGAISSQGVDPSQRFAILQHLLPMQRGRAVLMALDALGCLAAFVAPLAAGRGAKGKISLAGVVAGVAAALVCGATYAAGSRLDRDVAAQHAVFEQTEKALAANGITPPSSRGAQPLSGKAAILVRRDGSILDERAPEPGDDEDGPPSVVVAADASLTFEQLMAGAGAALLGAGRPSVRIGFVALPRAHLDLASLGPLAGLAGTDLLEIRATLHGKLADGLPAPAARAPWTPEPDGPSAAALAVVPDGDAGRLVLWSGVGKMRKLAETMPLGDDADDARSKLIAELRGEHPEIGATLLAPAPGDTLARVVAELQAIRRSLPGTTDALVLTADRVTLERAPVRDETPPPRNAGDVVTSMRAGFRRCYNAGLLQDPEMKGTARLTTKVGADGEVLSVSTSGEGISAAVLDCLAKRVRAARFAPHEGAATTYVIPITFTTDR